MRTLLLALALLLAPLSLPAASAADADPWPLCAAPDYCVDVQDGRVCVTVHLGDLEGPYTRCQKTPTVARGELPGECRGAGESYCYKVENGRVCLTYDVGDLEGPRTWCLALGTTASVAPVCTYELVESVSVCVGNGCVTVYFGPAPRPVCTHVIESPRVCTTGLTDQAGVCYDRGCVDVIVGRHHERQCVTA